MWKAVLAGWVVLIAGGMGYYFGRSSWPVSAAPPAGDATGRPPQVQARARRTAEPPRQVEPRGRIGLPILALKPSDIQDTFDQARGSDRKHEATDILSPTGTPVLAVAGGTIKKLFLSVPGGITIYQFDKSEEFCYYYAHLDRYAAGLHEGQEVRGGELIGYVGTTGNAPKDTPHLHFAIFQLGPEKKWWEGAAINPYPLLMEAVRR